MTDDLVKCLRNRANGFMQWVTVEQMATEAADRIEQLEAALRPFAKAADVLDEEEWDSLHIEGSNADITGEHCRNARAALGEKKE